MDTHTSQAASPKKFNLAIAVLAAILIILAVILLLRHSPESSQQKKDEDLWARIKKQERILTIYETVIGVKAKEFDSKLKSFKSGMAHYEMNAELLGDPGAKSGEIPRDLMFMESQLKSEMDFVSSLIQERDELTQEIAQMHFHRKHPASASKDSL